MHWSHHPSTCLPIHIGDNGARHFFQVRLPIIMFILFPIVWEAIRQVEGIGCEVINITADGASPNRKFFRMHGDGLVYKAYNPYADPKEKRPVFFICDPPHLMKTTRNCWSHSSSSGTRLMKAGTLFTFHSNFDLTILP